MLKSQPSGSVDRSALEPYSTSDPFLALSGPKLERAQKLSIIGGGFSGTLSVIEILRGYRELAKGRDPLSLPSLQIHWFDKTGIFGPGLPYREQANPEDSDVFILNQPARQMSPFKEHPDDYTNWLKSEGLSYAENDFTPRSLFGRYLKIRLKEAELGVHNLSLPIEILKIRADVDLRRVDPTIFGRGIILARGHSYRGSTSAITLLPGFVSDPYSVENYRRALSQGVKAPQDALLIGGGPTTTDAVRALEHLGFNGRYTIISSSPGIPWKYDPKLYTPDSFDKFSLKYLALNNIPENPTYRFLGRLLNRDIKLAESLRFGVGHVYYKVDLDQLLRERPGEGTELFAKKISFLRGALATPQNAELVSSLYRAGRLSFYKGRANFERSSHSDGVGFKISVEKQKGETSLRRGDIVIDCAPLERVSRAQIVRPTEETPSFQVGPERPVASVFGRTWGVESFRDEIKEAAHALVYNLFNKK